MFLSRICLNPRKRKTLAALTNPNVFHGALQEAMKDENGAWSTDRTLWRLETLKGSQYLLILSRVKPNLRILEDQFGFVGEGIIKNYDPLLESIKEGQTYRFRIAANPTYTGMYNGKEKRLAQLIPSKQLDWIKEKGLANGFKADEVIIQSKKWISIRKPANRRAKVNFLAVQFDGVLTVTDAELFKKALVNGIGHEKTYGMGLLSIAKITV